MRGKGIAALVAAVSVGALCAGAALPAAATTRDAAVDTAAEDAPVLARAVGMEMYDADLVTLVAPTPVAEWRGGDEQRTTRDAVDDVFRLNTTQASGLVASAGAGGARSEVADGVFALRDRPAVEFEGLAATCSADAEPTLSLDRLTIDGVDVTAEALAEPGWRYDLPDSMWGPTSVIAGELTTDASGATTMVGLRIQGETGASEISRVRLGVVTCAESGAWPAPTPPAEPVEITEPVVTGVSVTDVDGTALIAGEPRIEGAEQEARSDSVIAAGGYPASARDVSVSTGLDGGAEFSLDEFTQLPGAGEDALAEYRWSALRVYGLSASVDADGEMSVSFANPSSAVFVNGVWINTATDLYTGLDADGNERVRIRFGERVENPDGSVTLTALHYTDLTGTHPEVRLGEVRLPAPADETPVERTSAVWGVSVTDIDGSELIAPQPRVDEPGASADAELVEARDGYPATARDVSVALGEAGGAEFSVDEFTQLPGAGEDALAEYRWSALRVYGLSASVDADGEMSVSFANPSSAVFVNGVWINTATDLYTGLDAEGNERVRIRFGERVENPDGSVTLTALHYTDLTGTHPEVRLGEVTLAADAEPTEPEPEPEPGEPGEPGEPVPAEPEGWYAFGVRASGASHLAAQPVAIPAADAHAATAPAARAAGVTAVDDAFAGDGASGQISLEGVSLASAPLAGTATVADLVLYPSTSVEVRLSDLSVEIDGAEVTVTSGGGTIAGQPIAAGEIMPNTVVALPAGGSVTLASDVVDDGARTVTGLRFDDASGLGAAIEVAVVTSAAVAAPPVEEEPAPGDGDGSGDGDGPDGGAGSGGGVTSPGALSPDGSSPAGTAGTGSLAVTGGESVAGWVAALALLLLLSGAGLAARRRRVVR